MKRFFKKVIALVRAQFMQLEGRWEDDLLWCPSQCYFYFHKKGVSWCVYLRWRTCDPWRANIVKNLNVLDAGEQEWTDLPLNHYKDIELWQAKEEAIFLAKLYLAGYFDDEIEEIFPGSGVFTLKDI